MPAVAKTSPSKKGGYSGYELSRFTEDWTQIAVKHKCPICKTLTDSAVHAELPFCSERCRVRDLGAWASEKYVVSEPVFDEEELAEGDRKEIFIDLEDSHDTEH
jgi:endogenous inhibitor of DNA gyrase (YacG/DUF329 family)